VTTNVLGPRPQNTNSARLAIFDRDATIIDVVRDEELGAISVAFHPDQIKLLDGAVEGMRALQDAGFILAIATNQPAPAKGQFSAHAVRRTNDALLARLADLGVKVAALEACMHHPEGGPGGDPELVRSCECRKPKPGMLRTLLERFAADPSRSWMIGDSMGDVEAGRAAGLRTALVFLPNRCELCPLRYGLGRGTGAVAPLAQQSVTVAGPAPDIHGTTLAELARGILGHG
jgi:D-glycero-D-manno-heptose 1,7-bisphosphate phosphatase